MYGSSWEELYTWVPVIKARDLERKALVLRWWRRVTIFQSEKAFGDWKMREATP